MAGFRRARMPSLDGATAWLNSAPLDPAGLRGSVVLVDFWTLTCINWLRTVPYVRAWSRAYRGDGLVVIGVHTPEFSFEHDLDLVRLATAERGIDYPVAVDNDYAVWRAFDNHYWPALYFVDAAGTIRDRHFGEGRYEESERAVQRLLGIERELVRVDGEGVEAEADWSHLRAPETYLGYARAANFASPGAAAPGRRASYQLPERLPANHWALDGEWTIGRESVLLHEAGGRLAFRFHARDAHLVLSPGTRGPIPFRVLVDGAVPGPRHGVDVAADGTGVLRDGRLYQSCGSRTRSATGRWRSRSPNPAPRRTCSPSDDRGGRRCPRRPTGRAVAIGERPPGRSSTRMPRRSYGSRAAGDGSGADEPGGPGR